MKGGECAGEFLNPTKEVLEASRGDNSSPETVLSSPFDSLIPPIMHPDFDAFYEFTRLGRKSR